MQSLEVIAQRQTIHQYLSEVSNTKFVLSPPGWGIDCFRTWESILFGAIPIVAYSKTLQGLYDESPVYVKYNWTEPLTEDMLLDFKPSVTDKRVVLAQYWFDLIHSYRTQPNKEQ